MGKYVFLLILVLGPTACVAEAKKIGSQEECEKAGGAWSRLGLLGTERCVMPTADKGKECGDSSECESFCVAPDGAKPGSAVKGVCHGSHERLGTCLAEVKNGKAEFALCVD